MQLLLLPLHRHSNSRSYHLAELVYVEATPVRHHICLHADCGRFRAIVQPGHCGSSVLAPLHACCPSAPQVRLPPAVQSSAYCPCCATRHRTTQDCVSSATCGPLAGHSIANVHPHSPSTQTRCMHWPKSHTHALLQQQLDLNSSTRVPKTAKSRWAVAPRLRYTRRHAAIKTRTPGQCDISDLSYTIPTPAPRNSLLAAKYKTQSRQQTVPALAVTWQHVQPSCSGRRQACPASTAAGLH